MAPKTTKTTVERARGAARALAYEFGGQWFVLAARVAYKEEPGIESAAVDKNGLIYLNPDFTRDIPYPELKGSIAHEMLHVVLRHFERAITLGLISADGKPVPGREQDLPTWNIACDWTINAALRDAKIALPSWVVYPDPKYTGPLQAEPVFHWLKSQVKQHGGSGGSGQDQKQGQPRPGAGCGPIAPKGQGAGETPAQGDKPHGLKPGESWIQVASDMRAAAQAIGQGSSALAHLLQPYEPTIDWTKVIRRGFNLAQVRPGRDFSTYSRLARRQGLGNLIQPGWISGAPSVAFVVDISGSMAREWVSQIVAEILSGCATFGTRAFLATHTDRLEWAGWVTQGDKGKIVEACGRSGGTDPRPAYDRVREEKARFQVLVHFTDCEITPPWPENPARRLVIGAFGRGADGNAYCPFPEGAEVIPCHVPTE